MIKRRNGWYFPASHDKVEAMGTPTLVTIYYLEMTSPDELVPARRTVPGLAIRQARIPCPELNRFFYTTVGADWHWYERLSWDDHQWLAYLDRPELETWIAYLEDTPAGYVELEKQPGQQVEIAYFGLLPRFVGRGIGGLFLTAAIRRAWEMDARRVWVHTCTLDHPRALQNYQARGFRLYDTVEKVVELPAGQGSLTPTG